MPNEKLRTFSELSRDEEVSLADLMATLKATAASGEDIEYWTVVGVIEKVWKKKRIPNKDIDQMVCDCNPPGSRPSSGETKRKYTQIKRYLDSMKAW